jgi:beta-glucanase (GH16 family)
MSFFHHQPASRVRGTDLLDRPAAKGNDMVDESRSFRPVNSRRLRARAILTIVLVAATVALGGIRTADLAGPAPPGAQAPAAQAPATRPSETQAPETKAPATQAPNGCGRAEGGAVGTVAAEPGLNICTPPTQILNFDGAAGSEIDDQSWNHETGGNGWGNNELQTYTDKLSNSSLDGNGQLRITARRTNATGADGIFRYYTSARITTARKVEIPPGSYVEAGITAPTGTGVWPAFWLLGSNIDRVGWPAAGELDVFEAFGSRPTVANERIHLSSSEDASTDKPFGERVPQASVDFGHPLDSEQHTYGVFFDDTRVQFYVDRQPRLSLTADQARASGRSWPFGKDMYIILNVAVGGQEDPSETSFPRTMTVSPISIWEGFSTRP